MDYGKIISFGFANAWKHKSLWILGFFVSGGMNFQFGDTGDINFRDWGVGRDYAADILRRILENPLIIVAIVAVVLFLILLFVIMGTISVGALIEAARRFRQNDTYRFGEVFGIGVRYFWKLLGIGILTFIVAFAFVIFHILIGVAAFLIHVALGIISLLILIPTFIVGIFIITVTASLAERLIVIKNENVFDAIGNGFSLWVRNLGPTILYVLIYIGLSIGVVIATMMVILFVAMPFIGIAFVNWLVAIVLGIPVILLVLLVVQGFSGSAMHMMTTEFYFRISARSEGPQLASAGIGPSAPTPAPVPPSPSDIPPNQPQGTTPLDQAPLPDSPHPSQSWPPPDEPPPPPKNSPPPESLL